MKFPSVSMATRLAMLEPPERKVSMVLDTDTYNEIDDQFALVYALVGERVNVEAIYAAPFHNNRSNGPEDGMEKSYEEILRVLSKLGKSPEGFVFKGSRGYLESEREPQASEAAADLVERAMTRSADDPLYVTAVGAITNVASAILLEPRIIERIVVVWLGGHAYHWPDTGEFNLKQDVRAARLVFDSGAALVHVPCQGVTSHLLTTRTEIERFVRGSGDVGRYLAEIFAEYGGGRELWSKVLWDVAAVAYLVDPKWTPSQLAHSPIVTDQLTWSVDPSRHLIRYVRFVHRDAIFHDLFEKLRVNGRRA